MAVETLEDLCVNRVFLVGYDLLSHFSLKNFCFFMKDITFAERLSQKLLNKILLHDCSVLYDFAPYLSSISYITLESMKFENLEFLKQFNLSSFSCKSMKLLYIDEFLLNFNSKTLSKMQYLRLRKICIQTDELWLLTQFVNLKFLDLSHSDLVTTNLKQICTSMPSLVGLNISETAVDSLTPLISLCHQLEFLDIHNLPPEAYTNIFAVVSVLDKLRHLDISLMTYSTIYLGNEEDMLSCRCLSSLRLLDMSGHQGNVRVRLLIAMLRKMSRLKFFIFNPDSGLHMFTDDLKLKRFIQQNAQLTVIGALSKETRLNGLVYALEQRRYLTVSLHQLFDKTRDLATVSDSLRTTLMKHLRQITAKKHDLLVAITAVLYNVTKGRLVEHWSRVQLSEMMTLLIVFLGTADQYQQLTVNIFLIVCSDFILQTIVFDKLQLAQLVFRGMAKYETDNISQTGLIIISVIASELTKFQLSTLVADVHNFRVLLAIICRRCLWQSDLLRVAKDSYLAEIRPGLPIGGEPHFDTTLKFALSSLWNLTDECTVACKQFVEQQGLFIYLHMINKFKSSSVEISSHIYNKCLGLLNNIAEEKTCRSALLTQQYMNFLIDMLDQEDIQMTYFAGGILSNLLLISDNEWNGKCEHSKAFYENRIYVAVDSWVSPSYLMASYRSFYPFENLIANAGSSRAILLWALWAIRHTMKIERARYRSILEKHSQLIEYIDLLAQNHNSAYARIRVIASDILLLFKEDSSDSDVIFQMMID